MITLFVTLILFIVIILTFRYLIYKHNKGKYIKAGKKWDGIVKELSRRK